MVTGGRTPDATGETQATTAGTGDLVIRIDGRQPLSAAPVAALAAVCDSPEDRGEHGTVIVHVSGAPEETSASDMPIALVS